jgi:hypothetical protein
LVLDAVEVGQRSEALARLVKVVAPSAAIQWTEVVVLPRVRINSTTELVAKILKRTLFLAHCWRR